MSKRDPFLPLRHMLDHAREARDLVRDKTFEELQADRVMALALTRLLEIVGEAASRVPSEVREQHPEIEWRDIVGLRNRVIHGYDAVDLAVVWRILEADVPLLIDRLEQIISRTPH